VAEHECGEKCTSFVRVIVTGWEGIGNGVASCNETSLFDTCRFYVDPLSLLVAFVFFLFPFFKQ